MINWFGRLTAYGWIDLGSDIILVLLMLAVVALLVGVIWDLERLLKQRTGADSRIDGVLKLHVAHSDRLAVLEAGRPDGDQVDDDVRPPDASGPATVPAGAAIDEAHEEFIRRELGGRTFQFRPTDEARP